MAIANDKFSSVDELYVRLLPALNTKVCEIKRLKIDYIKELNVWDYCINVIWKNKKDIRLYEMVNDILNIKPFDLIKYIRIDRRNLNE